MNLSTGQNPVRVDSTSSNSSSPTSDLPIGRYRIWVRATQKYGAPSPWNAFVTVQVSTPPAVSVVPNDRKNARPQLTWNAVPGAVRYEVWADNLTTKNSKVFHSGNLTTTSYTPSSDLGFAHDRFWVRALDAANVPGNWSQPVDYSRVGVSTELERIAFDGLNGPSSFEWDPLPGTVRYELWADNLTTGTTKAISDSSVTAPTFVPGFDVPFGQYRVWVRGIDDLGIPSAWSPTSMAVNGPLPVSPVQPTFDRQPTFSWGDIAGVGTYELYINSNGTVLNPVGLVSSSWTPSVELPVGNLSWWVRPWAANGSARSWSAKATSYVGGKSTFLGAERGGNELPASVTFSWQAVTGAGRYILHLERSGFGVVICQDDLTATSYASPATLVGGQYRAWIKAVDSRDNNSGIWSDMFTFTLADSRITDDGDLFADGSSVLQPVAVALAGQRFSEDWELINTRPERQAAREMVRWEGDGDMYSPPSGASEKQPKGSSWSLDALMTEQDADLIDKVLSGVMPVTAEL